MAKEDEVLFGTWINPDYDETRDYGKIIITPEGTYVHYDKIYSDRTYFKYGYTITEKWTDSDGNTFYKLIATDISREKSDFKTKWYFLAKIDKTGNVYENVISKQVFPSEIDPYGRYAIHYRQ